MNSGVEKDGMNQRFRIDGMEYEVAKLPKECQTLVERLTFAQLRLQELMNQQALLTKAKNAYIADLKTEIIQGRAGIDLATLFSDG